MAHLPGTDSGDVKYGRYQMREEAVAGLSQPLLNFFFSLTQRMPFLRKLPAGAK